MRDLVVLFTIYGAHNSLEYNFYPNHYKKTKPSNVTPVHTLVMYRVMDLGPVLNVDPFTLTWVTPKALFFQVTGSV